MAIKNHQYGNLRYTLPRAQTGVVLLAFILVFIVASSFYLTKKLNTNLVKTQHSVETGIAMKAAKNALIGYAVTFPEVDAKTPGDPIDGPGYLPCPDLNNDGSAASNCSAAGNTTIGRLPNQTLRLEELRDASGQRLWYALSENFRFGNNKTIPLNSESPSSAELSVNGIGDIVAVIIAPGAPVNGQDRDPDEITIANEITNYLEGDNNDLDTDFVTTLGDLKRNDGEYDVNGNYTFNDRLIFITRQELMEAVEKRVLGEVSMMLTNYFDFIDTDNDGDAAYPWLTPFADPKASKPALSGEHDGGGDAANLSDSSRDFNVWGVTIGDVVRNLTDGSVGTVTAVAATTLTIGGGMSLGTENDFDDDDEYYIYPAALSDTGQLTGTATNANNNASLEDTNNDFVELEIAIGDIVDNLTDGSSGVVESVSATELTFITLPNTLTLSGGTENDFDTNDVYRVRSQHGKATADTDTNGLTLEDTTNDFVVMGILAGDIVVNRTDGSTGRVSAVAANTLTVDELYFGSDNSFEVNDYYSLSRNTTDNSSREGLLAFHEVGKIFHTSFNLDWNTTVLNTGDVVFDTVAFTNVEADYQMARRYLENYALAGSESVDDANGFCIWLVPEIADCYGYFRDYLSFDGRQETDRGNLNDRIDDSAVTFNTDSIKRGDIVQNYDDEKLPLVLSGIVDASNSGTVTGVPTSLTLQDTNNNFLNVNISVGETLFNTTDGSSGIINSVTATEITISLLRGGTDNIFEVGDDYQIGTVPTMYDATDFSGLIPYSYLIHNNTQGTQGLIAKIVDSNTLEIESYIGTFSTPIVFNVGDNYMIYEPENVVVDYIVSETELVTDQYTSYQPDFERNEYFRVIPAANSFTGRVDDEFEFGEGGLGADLLAGQVKMQDDSADFIDEGVTIGDVIYVPERDIYFGEILSVTTTTITTTLYAVGSHTKHFHDGDDYTIFHDYVFSREHIFHAKFRGDPSANTLSEERVRDVCLGYEAGCIRIYGTATSGSSGLVLEDDGKNFVSLGVAAGDYVTNITDGSIGTVTSRTTDTITVTSLDGGTDNDFDEDDIYRVTFPNPVNFSGNGGAPLITLRDYEEDETTEVGRATFTPTSASSGSIRVSNINFSLFENNGEIPQWFLKNKWHQLMYIAYSAGDSPNGGAVCDPDPDNDPNTRDSECLTLTGSGFRDYNKRALILIAGDDRDNITCNVSGKVSNANGTGTILTDGGARFQTDYIEVGDTLSNVDDGSAGVVISVDSNTEITHTGLIGGTENDWDVDDTYQLTKNFDQDRTKGNISDYYEGDDCDQNDDKYGVEVSDPQNDLSIIATFNDQVRVLATSP